MPDIVEEQELATLPIIEYLPGTIFEYDFRGNGDLEFVDVMGRWRRVRGCSADRHTGIHSFEEDLLELDHITSTLTDALPGDTTLEQLYLTNDRFRFLVDACVTANHIELKWFSPRMLTWMLFDRVENGYQVKAALRVLNNIPESKYSAGGGGRIEGANEWMALIATYCGGDIAKAHELAKMVAARDLMPELDALGYFSLDGKARHKRDVELWSNEQRRQAERMWQQGQSAAPQESQGGPQNQAQPPQMPRVRAIIPEIADTVSTQPQPANAEPVKPVEPVELVNTNVDTEIPPPAPGPVTPTEPEETPPITEAGGADGS